MHPSLSRLIESALEEDIGSGDITARYFIPEEKNATAHLVARQDGIIAGTEIAQEIFRRIDSTLDCQLLLEDSSQVSRGALIMKISGRARSILTAERTALNFLQRMSGVASLTAKYVSLVHGTRAKILDTRKTIPGWRILDKQAVLAGGGTNHRMGLFDRAMVKDNHLTTGGAKNLLEKSISELKQNHPHIRIELEADSIEQVRTFLTLTNVDYILLDNMTLEQMRECVYLRGESNILLEASGGVTLQTVRAIAETGVDYISVGAITHSAPAMDLALDFV